MNKGNDIFNVSYFERGLSAFGISLSEKQMNQFLSFYELLVEWNKVMNLTGITEFQDVVQKHFLDSLTLVKACQLSNQTVIDVGTGAGFPGIPLKIVFPELEITLLDSLSKRINFLDTVIDKLDLDKIEAIHGRAEDFAQKTFYREKFDLCVSRAVSNMTTLSEYCLPFVKIGGSFISYKSEKLTEELKDAKNAISILGGMVTDQVELVLPASDIYRNLLVIKKEKKHTGKISEESRFSRKGSD